MMIADWTPVTDPPKNPGRYLIAYDSAEDGPMVYTAEFGYNPDESENPGEPWWADDGPTGEDFTGYVLAWMPIPSYEG